jgi:uncharacterized protein (DUF488 family)
VVLYTVGHGTRSTEELVAVLSQVGVGRLLDVRRYPGSRRSPHLARQVLSTTLPAAGIAYEWWGHELGGRRSRAPASHHPALRNDAFRAYADHMGSPEFRTALEGLVASARGATAPSALMCAETLWWRCHRRLIADALVLRGVEVVHLVRVGGLESHRLHPAARPDEAGWPVYDVAGPRPSSGTPPR